MKYRDRPLAALAFDGAVARCLAGRLLVLATLAAALAVSPVMARDTGYVFVSNEKSDEVTVLDRTLNFVASIPTSRRPRDMHLDAARQRLYVACGDDNAIDIIDVATLTVIDSIPTGPSPEVFAFSPDESRIYVSNEESSALEVLDARSGASLQSIPTGAEPEGVIVSADGATVYVTSEIADLVHVVDARSGAVTDNIFVGTRPRRFVLANGGKELWVSAELSSEVYVIDTHTNTVAQVLQFLPPGFRAEDVTPVGMAVTADGDKVIVSLGRANHVAVVDAASKAVLGYILVGSRAWSVALSHDDRTAIVANGLSDDVTLIDLTSMRAVKSVPIGRVPHTVVIDD